VIAWWVKVEFCTAIPIAARMLVYLFGAGVDKKLNASAPALQ
jgi:hypothetical protein